MNIKADNKNVGSMKTNEARKSIILLCKSCIRRERTSRVSSHLVTYECNRITVGPQNIMLHLHCSFKIMLWLHAFRYANCLMLSLLVCNFPLKQMYLKVLTVAGNPLNACQYPCFAVSDKVKKKCFTGSLMGQYKELILKSLKSNP
uniref:Uncharacterized protein n=1 Tax=Micrurus corallinus TaxID=54390 RepID=A0A2D4GAL4_MICCO